MKHAYQVIVGNIGIVYEGPNDFEAIREYNTYVSQSKENYGRAAGEPITLLRDDEIYKEHYGEIEQ